MNFNIISEEKFCLQSKQTQLSSGLVPQLWVKHTQLADVHVSESIYRIALILCKFTDRLLIYWRFT